MVTNWQQKLLALTLALVNISSAHGFGCCIGFWEIANVRTEIFFPLRSMKADATIVNGIVKVSVKQYFETVTDIVVPDIWQTRYEIPFDEQGAITEFRASYDDRVIEGVVKSDEEAQQEFDDALDEGKPAFLGEQTSAGVFKLEFGNVPLNRLVVVEFVYIAEVQARDKDTLRFVIPSTLAPEMNPALGGPADLEYDDGAFTLSVKAFSTVGAISVSSPSHSTIMTVTDIPNGMKQIDMVDRELQRRDIILILETQAVQDVQARIFEELRDDGTTALMLSLLPEISSFGVIPLNTEFIFLVDRSGSMRGDRIRQTATALDVVLKSLPAGSLFNFVSFGTSFEYLFATSASVDDMTSFAQGVTFAGSLSANFGGTSILGPIQSILQSSPTPGFQRALFVLTDGEVNNTEDVVDWISNNRGSTKCFSLGIGDADRELINGIARAGGGTAEFVDSDALATITEVAQNQVEVATQANFLSNFFVEWGESPSGVETPFALDTVFSNRRTLVYYLTTGPSPAFVAINAMIGGQLPYRLEIPSSLFLNATAVTQGETIVGPMGAREAIRDLEEERSVFHSEGNADATAVKNEIIRLGVKYQITSSETSFIAIDNLDWTSRNSGQRNDGTTGGGTSPPISAPTSGGSAGPDFVVCFSGENVVQTRDRGFVAMSKLAIGDMVEAGDGKFSRVYSFGHRNTDEVAAYLQIHADGIDAPLEISSDHMVFVDTVGAVPASMVTIGDKLTLGGIKRAATAKVTNIAVVNRVGAYAPFTESGRIVVNQVMASSYVSLQDSSGFFEIGGVKIVSMQWLAHAYQGPHRLVCNVWSSAFCENEGYTKEGISYWVYGPLVASRWLLDQCSMLTIVLSLPVVAVGVLCHVLEQVLMMTMVDVRLVCVVLFGVFVVRSVTGKKAKMV